MSQINERLDTFSQKEKDEVKDQDERSKISSLIMKYGKRKVRAAQTKKAQDEKRTGKRISFFELKKRIEDSKEKERDKEKGVPFYDEKGRGRIIDGKKVYFNEEPNWNDGVNVRWNLTPNKKEVSLNLNGTTLASKKSEKWTGKTKPKSAVNKALIDLKNTQDPARNLPGMKSEEKSLKDLPGLGGGGGGTNSITEKSKRKKNIFKTYKPTQRDLDQEK